MAADPLGGVGRGANEFDRWRVESPAVAAVPSLVRVREVRNGAFEAVCTGSEKSRNDTVDPAKEMAMIPRSPTSESSLDASASAGRVVGGPLFDNLAGEFEMVLFEFRQDRVAQKSG
jgi:hypothetical protein